MRSTTATFLLGLATGYYLGSRPGEQALAEIRDVSARANDQVHGVIRQVASWREHRTEQAWTESATNPLLQSLDDLDADEPIDPSGSEYAVPDDLSTMNRLAPHSATGTGRPVGDSDRHQDDLIDEFGEESFPSSDPPSTWAGSDRPGRRDV